MSFDQTKAQRAIDFFERILVHTKGEWAGQPFVLLPWQRDLVSRLFGTIREDGTRQYRTAYVEIPKKQGKALAIDTPIPTADGWALMGELQPGRRVFSETGEPCNVVGVTEPMIGHSCYEVVFSDGCRIIADAEHLWRTERYRTGRPYGKQLAGVKKADFPIKEEDRIITTAEIARTLLAPSGKLLMRNHRVPVAGALRLPEAILPIPPYIFGAWLGDGRSNGGSITIGYADSQILTEINIEGTPTTEYKSSNANSGAYKLGNGHRGQSQSERDGSIQARLRRLGVLDNKHIPMGYLRASHQQRLDLLQGLMDTDGYASPTGQCEYTTISARLAQGVCELVCSLGMKPLMTEGRSKLNGRDCGPKYRIKFYADKANPVFRLARKSTRQKNCVGSSARTTRRQIVAVNPVETVPVKCIQVDSPSGLFLAGESMIPTHNSEIAAGIALYLLVADGEAGAEVYGAAGDRDQASIVFNVAADMVRMSGALSKRLEIIPSTKRIINKQTRGIYRALSSEAFTKHGFNVSGLVFDELHTQPNRELWDTLTKGTAARRQPMTFAITTAGIYDPHSICWEQHAYARQILDGVITDDTFLPIIYAADDTDDWTAEATWRKANPSLGVTVQLDYYQHEVESALQVPAQENTFRRLHLNQWVRQETRWLPLHAWDECAGIVDEEELAGQPCWGGLDLASTTDIASLTLTFRVEDAYRSIWRLWCPEDSIEQRSRRDRVPYDLWQRQGHLIATPGNVIDYAWIRHEIEQLAGQFAIQDIAYDRWGATQLSIELQDAGLTVVPFGQGYASMSAPTKELLTLVLGKKLRHGNNPVVRWAADNLVVVQDAAGNLKPAKDKAREKIDPMVSLIMSIDRAARNENGPSKYESEGLTIL